jgi:AcrR family transcriptional regulator
METRAAREAETRERIVRAAVKLHADRGALHTPFAAIAKRAQVSPQTVYNHFPDLRTLLGACTRPRRRARARRRRDVVPRRPHRRGAAAPPRACRVRAPRVLRAVAAPRLRRGRVQPELDAIFAAGDEEVRRLAVAALAPDREPAPAFADAAFLLLDYPAWKTLTRERPRPRRPASPATPSPTSSRASPDRPEPERSCHEPIDLHLRRRDRRRHLPDQHARPPSVVPGGFTFNQYLIRDEAPLLFHTGPRMIFDAVRGGIERVLPVKTLRYVSFSHVEADECGTLNQFLALAPRAVPLCGQVAAMVSIGDLADRAPHALADGETLSLGRHVVKWHDAPHVPHGWECGFLSETTTRTFFCGDLFTQFGERHPALTGADILGPSEEGRLAMDYYAHAPDTGARLERFAAMAPTTLALMHGPAFRGDGAAMLRGLAARLA